MASLAISFKLMISKISKKNDSPSHNKQENGDPPVIINKKMVTPLR